MSPNIEVEYPRAPWLGKGRIIGTRWKGQELLVRFEKGMIMWVHRTKLILKDKPRQVKLPTPTYKSEYKEIGLSPTVYTARKMIEAFKLGIVPHDEVRNFTFGRDKEIEKFEEGFRRFEKTGSSVMTIEGEYGAGKTHFLDYMYFTALEQGYAVAKVALDPIDVTPYKCKNVYREIVKSFAAGDKNFRSFLTECASTTNQLQDKPHKFLTPILKTIRETTPDDTVWKWIEGDYLPRWYQNKLLEVRRLPLLPDFSTSADNYCYILSGIGYLTKKIGLKGFVILIDEAETLFHLWWKTMALERGVNLFKGLALTTLGELPTTLTTNIVKEEWHNAYVEKVGQYTLIHRGVKSCMTPYLYHNPSNIFLVLAFTPTVLSVYRDIIETIGNKGIHISLLKLNMYQLKDMFVRLNEIYDQAFPLRKINPEDANYVFNRVKNLGDRSIRAFIKATIDAFDLLRHYPNEPPNKLLET